MRYDRVYFWNGGTEKGMWRETAVVAPETANDLCKRIRNQGYVCMPGNSSIGAPEGPPSVEAFNALESLTRYGWKARTAQTTEWKWLCQACAEYHERSAK